MKKIFCLLLLLISIKGILVGQVNIELKNSFNDSLSLHQTTIDKAGSKFLIHTEEGWTMKISFLHPSIVRVQLAPAAGFEPSLTERFGFVKNDWKETPVKVIDQEGFTLLKGEALTVKVSKQDLKIALLDNQGKELVEQRAASAWLPKGGGRLRFEMPVEEHIFGLGFQRKTMDCRGKTFAWKREYRSENATIPFFLSTKGYGFLSNNTWEHHFDFASSSNGFDIVAADGQQDFYLIGGANFATILENYIQLTGAPQMVPRWGLGLLYICRYYEDQKGVLEIANNFKKHDIPCDMISLEPGWEDSSYSMKWKWSPERFPKPSEMIKELGAKGFHFGLWESGKAPFVGYEDKKKKKNWYADRIKASLKIGVSFFKQDDPYPRMLQSTELNDAVFVNDTVALKSRFNKSIKSLANSLYSETAINEFQRITGQRTFILFNSYVSSFGSHRWPTGWAGDSKAGTGLLNAGLAAQSMVSHDMDAASLAGIHLGYLSPLALIDAWAYFHEPWLYPNYLLRAHRFYGKLRNRLTPYLYSSQAQSHFSGAPMMRPMVFAYQDDSVTWNLSKQYLLGENLLVGLESKVYLPKGEWVDYWTNERFVSKGQWINQSLKGVQGGGLFVKSGSILPLQPVTPNLHGQPPILVALDIFPGKQSGKGWLYEDDGNTMDYSKNQFAKTDFSVTSTDMGVTVQVGKRTGKYREMNQRAYLLQVHHLEKIETAICKGKNLQKSASKESLLHQTEQAAWWYDDTSHTLFVKTTDHWKLGYDSRGQNNDPERDSVYLSKGFFSEDSGFVCTIKAKPTNAANLIAKATKTETPNKLLVTANPPERICMGVDPKWLARKTRIFVELLNNDLLVDNAKNEIKLEVFDEQNNLIRTETKNAANGIAVFLGQEYLEEKTVFRVSTSGLEPVDVKIKKANTFIGNK